MNLEIQKIIEEYKGISDDKLCVTIDGRNYIDTELSSRKSELADMILEAAVNVIRKQIEISRKYKVYHPYDKRIQPERCSVKVEEIHNTRIYLSFTDEQCYTNGSYGETILHEDIINFDETEYALKCIDIRIKTIKYDIGRHKQAITELEKDLNDVRSCGLSIEADIIKQETNKLVNYRSTKD